MRGKYIASVAINILMFVKIKNSKNEKKKFGEKFLQPRIQ